MKEHYGSTVKDQSYFMHSRQDVMDVVKSYYAKNATPPAAMLEIGSGGGYTGAILKDLFPEMHYTGVELMPGPSQSSQDKIDVALCGNVEQMIAENDLKGIDSRKYDAVLFLDVLEHLTDPWSVLDRLSELLNPGGIVIGSIPNAGHFYVVNKLIRDTFEYDPEGGLLDKTHLRFFTLHTIHKMLNQKFAVQKVEWKYSTFSDYSFGKRLFFRFLKTFLPKMMVVQYIFIARLK